MGVVGCYEVVWDVGAGVRLKRIAAVAGHGCHYYAVAESVFPLAILRDSKRAEAGPRGGEALEPIVCVGFVEGKVRRRQNRKKGGNVEMGNDYMYIRNCRTKQSQQQTEDDARRGAKVGFLSIGSPVPQDRNTMRFRNKADTGHYLSARI